MAQSAKISSRATQLVLQKATKAIKISNTTATELQLENQRLKHQLEAISKLSTKRRAYIDPNKRFFNTERITAAIQREAAKPLKILTKIAEKKAKKLAANVQKKAIRVDVASNITC